MLRESYNVLCLLVLASALAITKQNCSFYASETKAPTLVPSSSAVNVVRCYAVRQLQRSPLQVNCCIRIIRFASRRIVPNVAYYESNDADAQPFANINNNSGSLEKDWKANISGRHQSFAKISLTAVNAVGPGGRLHARAHVARKLRRFDRFRAFRSRS